MSVAITLDPDKVARLQAVPGAMIDALVGAVEELSLYVEREVKERTPTSGAGTLRDSIGALPVSLSGTAVEGGVGTALAYAVPVELGSKPHMPPAEPIAEWVRRVIPGAATDADLAERVTQGIRWKIFRHGSRAQKMFEDGLAALASVEGGIIARHIDAALARLAAGTEGGATS